MRRKGIIALAVAAGAATVLAGTGPAAAHGKGHHREKDRSHAVFVQTNRPDGNTIKVFKRANDGKLTAMKGEVATGGLGAAAVDAPGDSLASQGSLVFHDDLLFAVNAGGSPQVHHGKDGTVSVFRVDGLKLKLLQKISSGGKFPVSIAVRDDLAFVVNGGGNGAVQGYRIKHDRLHPIPSNNRTLGLDNTNPPNFMTSPGQVGISPNGQFVFVTTKFINTLLAFRLDHHGVLSANPVTSPSEQGAAFAFTFHRHNKLIVAEAGDAARKPPGVSAVTAYKRDGQGSLELIDSVPNGQVATCWIQQVGRFHFVTNTGNLTISSYRIKPDGQPVLLAPVAARPAKNPIDMTTSGGFLYVQSGIGGFVEVYKVRSDGSLKLRQTVTDGLPVFANGIGMEGIAAS